jgi:hypothetical protein
MRTSDPTLKVPRYLRSCSNHLCVDLLLDNEYVTGTGEILDFIQIAEVKNCYYIRFEM